MFYKRNFKYFAIVLLVINFVLYRIHCENDCNCENITDETSCKNCNPNCVYKNSACIYCQDLYSKPYYRITENGEGTNTYTCNTIKEKSGNNNYKLIYGSKEFVEGDCPDDTTLKEDICYTDAQLGNLGRDKEYYYTEKKDGFTYIIYADKCPYIYQYYKIVSDNDEDKKCLEACESGNNYLTKNPRGNAFIFMCSNECQDSEFKYKETPSSSITYCLDKCPNEAKYYDSNNNCLASCNNFLIKDGNNNIKCSSEPCNTKIYIDTNKQIKICSDNDNDCPPETYPYLFSVNPNNYCLKSCKDSNSVLLGGDKKVTYLNETENKCTTEEEGNLFIDEIELKWVENCLLASSGPYINGNRCQKNCNKISNNSFECVEQCTQNEKFYVKDSNFCYEKCPGEYNFINYQNENECQKCNNPNDPENPADGEGFYGDNKKCYPSCNNIGEDYFHNKGDNYCFTGGCKNLYKYQPSDLKICYNSCEEIKSLGYIYEKDYKCYKSEPTVVEDGTYIYYSSSGIYKYTNNLEDCLKEGFSYLSGSNCVKQCDSEQNYRKLPSYNELGICFQFSSLDSAGTIPNECKYYNKTTNICSNNCDFFIIDDTEYVNQNKENCVLQCPESLYIFEKEKKCRSTCSLGFVKEESGKKKCMDTCDKFQLEGEASSPKKCVDKCKTVVNGNTQYMNFIIENGNKICKEQCNEGEYSLSKKDDHQLCLKNCSDTHPYINNNICTSECKYYREINKCAEKCEDGEYVFPGNICSTNKCPPDAPFYYTKDNVKICVSNCAEAELKYYKINGEEKVCTNSCGQLLYYEGKCVDNCPHGLFNNGTACISRCNKNIYKIDNGNLTCLDQCPSGEYKYLTSSGECVSKCPEGENYIGDNNKCLSSCKNNNGKDFYIKLNDSPNYQCLQNCNGYLNIEGTKLCVQSCDSMYIYGGICYKSCLSNSSPYQFSTIDNAGKKICSDKCHETQPNFANDKICINGCLNLPFNKTINNTENSKACVEECDLNSKYKFLNTETNDDTTTLYCKTNCPTTSKRYLKSNYKCIEKCPEPYNFVVEDGSNPTECLDKCPTDKPYARLKNEEYICSEIECGTNEDIANNQDYYYLNNKICIEKCESNDYTINNKKLCTTSCDYFDSKKLYSYVNNGVKKCVFFCLNETNSGSLLFSSLDGKCVDSCGQNEFYNSNDKICRVKCPTGKKIDGQECKDTCNSGESENKYENENGFCVKDCSESTSGYIYHKKDEFKCLKSCSNLYLEENVCRETCSDTNPYMYGKLCYPICPIDKRFFTDSNKTCISDCPKDKPYYTISGSNPNFYYECSSSCRAYIDNPDTNINARKCLGDTCNPEQYYIEINTNGQTQKVCYAECPSTHPFKDGKKCLNKCPKSMVHYPEEYECKQYSDCETKIIDYENSQCVERCSLNDYFYEETIGSSKFTFCVKSCSIASNIYKEIHGSETDISFKRSVDKKCIEECPTNSKPNENNECICERLFYYNKTTSVKYCLNKELTLCEEIKDYPILKVEENECSSYCQGILSLSGTECYNNNYKCEKNETIITEINGNRKCTCVDKYYYETINGRKVKKCLGQNEECPSPYLKYIKETKECLTACPAQKYNKTYGNICVSSCPYLTVEDESDHACKCEGKWYINDNYDVICLTGECPVHKELLIESTRQCVSTCIGTGFEFYSNKKCLSQCDPSKNTINSSIDPIFIQFATSFCQCKNTWYIDANRNEVCKDTDVSCIGLDNLNFKFMIEETKQCVNSCPDNYPYIFNNLCLKDCASVHNKNDTSKTCECKNLWKYDNEGKYKICLTSSECEEEYLLIKRTKECYKSNECPRSSPLLFEKICYDENNCPEDLNTKYDKINERCFCVNKWYKEEGKINCLSESGECPNGYPYLVYTTKECLKEASDDLFEFNYVLYTRCPEKTKENGKKCICDPSFGFWYSGETSDGREIMFCSQEKCPSYKPYNKYQEKECLSNCINSAPYLYQGICYTKCPNLTETTDNSNECQLKSVDNEITLTDLEKKMKENIVDLYAKSNSLTHHNPQKIVTTNATVEFYGVNKNNRGNVMQNIQSDLSYIDISECIDKLYSSNNINNADIIILKYDINKTPNNFLIKPVEYRFINSETGQELDATVCQHNSIKISYPVHDLINKYDALMNNLRQLEYINIDLISNNKQSLREKFDKGKEIVGDYSDIDIFNINDKIYSDICIAVEVDGKDLVLEDRINYFFPQLSLCENNCTYNHTDFINERIYCDCSYKVEFDFERNYTSFYEVNMNEIKANQKGNSNIGVMKCLSNFKYSKSLKNNGGFFYTLIIIIIEVALLFIIIFYEINLLLKKFKEKMKNDMDEFDHIQVNVVNSTKKREYEDVKTSQRMLQNPPKKKIEEYEMEFIPQEYLFLFFNHGQKDVWKKVERNNVPFKTQSNTKILLEQKKGFNYNNIKPTGPFPPGQNLLIIVDSMDEEVDEFMEILNKDKDKDKNKDEENNEINNNNNRSSKGTNKNSEKPSEKAKVYKRERNGKSISDYDPSDENYSVFDIDDEENPDYKKGFIDNLKINQRLMRRNYDIAVKNTKTNYFELLITEIIDKIYITKIIFFTKKFDIFSLQLSVYLLCHTLLLILNALFFDIKTIKKIWNEENYPGLGYYLGFGLLSCIIVWIIYKVFLCLLSNNDRVKEVLKLIHINNKYGLNKESAIYTKKSKLIWKIKFKISVYSIIEFCLLIFSFLYLTVFCSVYTGTKTRVFKAYGIALIEVLIIKILYGIVLSILRYISLSKKKKGLYEVVLFMNTYLV